VVALIRLLKPLEFYKDTELLSTEYKNVSSHGKATAGKMVQVLQA
jgi:hypothetical protein